jgi:hypothetical protein
MKGWRTILAGLGMAVAVPGLSYLAGIDWTQYGVTPNIAMVIAGAVTIGMRIITDTQVGGDTRGRKS